jgi:hypothetical protein
MIEIPARKARACGFAKCSSPAWPFNVEDSHAAASVTPPSDVSKRVSRTNVLSRHQRVILTLLFWLICQRPFSGPRRLASNPPNQSEVNPSIEPSRPSSAAVSQLLMIA